MYTSASTGPVTSSAYYDKIYHETGGTATYQLPASFDGGAAIYYFDVAKDEGAGTISVLNMCGDYGHAHTTVTGNQAASHDIWISGIDFDGSVESKFDEVPCADSHVAVNW